MSESESNLPPEPKPARSRREKFLINAALGAALLVGVVYAVKQAGLLWHEWVELQDDLHLSQLHSVAGYLNIAPIASFAQGPSPWYRVEGNQAFLWFGWERNSGHRWFQFGAGEIDPRRLHRPTCDFITQAIDYPLVETNGGTIWHRIPANSQVVGFKTEGQVSVYPVAILGKVLVINDIVGKHPYMVVVSPFARQHVAFSIYDASLEGRRVTLAHTGYFQDAKPVLFDRGTESLWIEMHDGLTAMAGKYFKKRLMRVSIPTPVSWQTWLSRNPQSRLVVGADRSLGIPKE
jgi:hypothetical protein